MENIVSRISEIARPFARIATDGERALLAVGGCDYARDVLIVRTDDRPVLLCDDEGRPAAWIDRRWAMLRDGGLMGRGENFRDAYFTGTASCRDTPRIVAAFRHLGVETLACRSRNAASIVATAIGSGSILRMLWIDRSLPPIVRARRGVTLIAEGGRSVVHADIAAVRERIRAVEEWGAPPPASTGSALRALGTALVHDRDWRPSPGEPRCGRSDLIEAMLDYVRRMECTERLVTMRGRAWRLFDVSSLFARHERWSVVFGTAADRTEGTDAVPTGSWEWDVHVAPAGDVVFGTTSERMDAFVAESSLPFVYGFLARVLRGERVYALPLPRTFVFAASLLTTDVRRYDRCLGVRVISAFPTSQRFVLFP